MPLTIKYNRNGAVVAVWHVTEPEQELRRLADAKDIAVCENFSSHARRCEWLAVRALLKELLGVPAVVEYDQSGKPSLRGCKHFLSISHTNGYVAVALSPEPVGLDVELATREVGAVYRRFMRDEELAGVPVSMVNRTKLLRWTSSEALYKLVGNLGGNFRDNIVVTSCDEGDSGVMNLSIVGLPCCCNDNFVVDFCFTDVLLLALCLRG